jgi:hypothetical protein
MPLFTKHFIIMKFKKILLGLTLLYTITAFTGNAATGDPGNNKATMKEKVAAMTEKQKEARIAELKTRVDEIKAIDKSKLNKSERKALRKEIRSINKEAHYLGAEEGAIVILGGALFSVLLLLLLA